MTLVLLGKGLVLRGWPSKIEVSWVLGIFSKFTNQDFNWKEGQKRGTPFSKGMWTKRSFEKPPWKWRFKVGQNSRCVFWESHAGIPNNSGDSRLVPFLHNHGSGKLPWKKGNYYWRDPFLTSMIMGGSVIKYVFECWYFSGCMHMKTSEFERPKPETNPNYPN